MCMIPLRSRVKETGGNDSNVARTISRHVLKPHRGIATRELVPPHLGRWPGEQNTLDFVEHQTGDDCYIITTHSAKSNVHRMRLPEVVEVSGRIGHSACNKLFPGL